MSHVKIVLPLADTEYQHELELYEVIEFQHIFDAATLALKQVYGARNKLKVTLDTENPTEYETYIQWNLKILLNDQVIGYAFARATQET